MNSLCSYAHRSPNGGINHTVTQAKLDITTGSTLEVFFVSVGRSLPDLLPASISPKARNEYALSFISYFSMPHILTWSRVVPLDCFSRCSSCVVYELKSVQQLCDQSKLQIYTNKKNVLSDISRGEIHCEPLYGKLK